jgi:putative ABC transport system ATP-binding protein
MSDVIEARQLTKIYEGGVQVSALRGVDLHIPRASFTAIMGPSGSGKSTLLNILGALEVPTTGQALVDGVDIGSLSDDQRAALRRRRIGFVFQQFNLLPIFTAVENVALPLRLDGATPEESTRRSDEVLAVVGMTARRDHIPSHLSGGEQQRVAIARALATSPAIILADEPTGNLDSGNGELVIGILRQLVDQQRQTVVMVTHDVLVASHADRVICLRDGLIESDFDPRLGIPAAAGLQEPRS